MPFVDYSLFRLAVFSKKLFILEWVFMKIKIKSYFTSLLFLITEQSIVQSRAYTPGQPNTTSRR